MVVFVSCAVMPDQKSAKPSKEESVRGTELNKKRKRLVERMAKKLENGHWRDVQRRLGRLSSTLDSEQKRSRLVDLYVARANLGAIDKQLESKSLSKAYQNRLDAAIKLLEGLVNPSVTGPIPDAAKVYAMIAHSIRGDNIDWSRLNEFQSEAIPGPILRRDRDVVSPIVVRAMRRQERYMTAVRVAGEAFRTRGDESKEGTKNESNLSRTDKILRADSFAVAEQLDDSTLQSLTEHQNSLLSCVAFWGLIQKRVAQGSKKVESGLLDRFSKLSSSCTRIGAGSRIKEMSNKLALLGGGRRLLLGALVPMSGKNQSVGESVVESSLLALSSYSEQKKRHLTMMFRDSKRSPEAVFKEFDERGVVAAVGPLRPERAKVYAEAAQEYGIPLITLTAKSAKPSDVDENYVFRNFIDAPSEAKAAASVTAEKLKDKKVAIVRPNIGYGKLMERVYKKRFNRLGGTVVDTLVYKRNKSNYTDVAKKLSNLDFEAIFLPDTAEKVAEVTAFIAQENIWGIDHDERPGIIDKKKGKRRLVHYVGTSLWQSASLRHATDYIGEAVIPAWFSPAFKEKKVEVFVDRFRRVFGRLPNKYEVFTYDSVSRLRELVVERGMHRSSAIRHALTSPVSRLQGVSGTTHFTNSGEPVRRVRFVSPDGADFERLPFAIQLNRKGKTLSVR
jgi:ABC-type branched-subunit amino acid transport system substrate-binding protein